MENKFKQFLKSHEVFVPYLDNKHLPIEDIIKYFEPEHYISGAFDWGDTPEGVGFWKKINDEWINELNKQ